MVKKIIFIVTLWILLIRITAAHSDEDFSQAEAIINKSISCKDLTEDQLELIGDYYMEQMHPGKSHEYMDQVMGGEGSESLRQAHISMAKRIYCNENVYTNYRMMQKRGYGMIGYNPLSYEYNWFLPLLFSLITVLLVILIFKQISKNDYNKANQ